MFTPRFGFGLGTGMNDADVIMGYVANGQVSIGA